MNVNNGITSFENPNYIFVLEDNQAKSKQENGTDEPADYETAITAAGFGKFSALIFLLMIPASTASMFSVSAMSYVFPVAKCDLDLSLDEKGMLNSVTYIGMISSGFLWGYLTDAIGRRKLIIYVYVIDAIFMIFCAFSQTYIMLVILKFLEGFIVNGGYAAFVTYANEFHSAKHRPLIPISIGIVTNCSAIFLPIMGILILSNNVHIPIFSDYIVLKSWNIFLLFCSIPSFMAGFFYIMFPESPKFLMATGKNEEALEVFRKIYSFNTGCPPETYQVKCLVPETQQCDEPSGKSCCDGLKEGWNHTRRFLHPPLNTKILLALIINFGLHLGVPIVFGFSKKRILIISGIASGLVCISIYLAQNVPMTIALISLAMGLVNLSMNMVITAATNIFPTQLRAMSISLIMVAGRLGSTAGNLMFPTLLHSGCMYPFITLGCIVIGTDEPADYETAITAAGFGKFSALIFHLMIPASTASMFGVTVMSYVFPVAKCVLDLSLDEKGMLHSVTYIGMIASGFLWSYLTNAIGRRKLIIYVYVIDAIFMIFCGFSQTYIMVYGGYAAFVTYANEFHSAKHRPLIPLSIGIVANCSAILIPIMSILILSNPVHIPMFNDYIVLKSWNIFLLFCSIPSFMAEFFYIMFHENPKFLMAAGKNEEALELFRKIYSFNTGCPLETYQVKCLVFETQQCDEPFEKSCCVGLKERRNHAT
ncbi:hypothetical protein FQA39_LY13282 [Lamprigera yunnana]|nr:hypothetical protein FQA39_LY13282 [Lamprigera yunnana]